MNLETLHDILVSNKFGRWADSGSQSIFIHASVIKSITSSEEGYIVEATTPRTKKVLENLFYNNPEVVIVLSYRN